VILKLHQREEAKEVREETVFNQTPPTDVTTGGSCAVLFIHLFICLFGGTGV
jgi:hypothetical protein